MKLLGLSFEVEDRRDFYIAGALFLLQFVYFQFQDSLVNIISENTPQLERVLVSLPFRSVPVAVRYFNIVVHALFSIAIVWFLNKNRRDTLWVVYLSVGLLLFYVGIHAIEKFTGAYVVQVMVVRIGTFLASPFKTIFSIPALLIRHTEQTEEGTSST